MGLFDGFTTRLPKYITVDGVAYNLFSEFDNPSDAEEEGKKLFRKSEIEEFQILFERDRNQRGETVGVYGLYVR